MGCKIIVVATSSWPQQFLDGANVCAGFKHMRGDENYGRSVWAETFLSM